MHKKKGISDEILFYFVLAIVVGGLVLVWVVGNFKDSGLL